MANPDVIELQVRVQALEDKFMSSSAEIITLCNQIDTTLQAIKAKQDASLTAAEATAIRDKLALVVAAAKLLAV